MRKFKQRHYKSQARLMVGPFGNGYYSIVYAMEAPSCGVVKFGRTLDVEKRLASIQGMSPVPISLLGHVWMPTDAETHLHEFLDEHRSHGEWFKRCPEVDVVTDLIAKKRVQQLCEVTGFRFEIPDWFEYMARARQPIVCPSDD